MCIRDSAYRVSDGPHWNVNPPLPIYSAAEAAALLLGGEAGDYSISVNSSRDSSTITNTGWYDTWGGPLQVLDQNRHVDSNQPGYTPGDNSAFVSDHSFYGLLSPYANTNFVWREVAKLEGSSVSETIEGTDGADKFIGHGGADVMTGGAGNDFFYFQFPSEGGAQITDFSTAEDMILIDAAGFGGNLQPGGLHDQNSASSSIFASGTDVAGGFTSASQRFYFDTAEHSLWFDADGKDAGAAQKILTVDPTVTLTHNDLLIV